MKPLHFLLGTVLLMFQAAALLAAETPDSIGGVGMALGVEMETGSLKIMRVISGGPAARAGLTAGLIVEKAGGVALQGKTINDAVALMRGEIGTKVTLHIVDPAAHHTNKVELTRARILLASARANLGEPAAPLVIKDWVKGAPVNVRDGKAVYVVEFWATWCGPCRVSIPHLTDLQKQWKDRGVVVVGVSDEAVTTVKPFVDKMAAKMDYVVACDDNRTTYAGYMDAYGLNGIPNAFIVGRDGRVLWSGHPLSGLDEALEKAVSGKLTVPLAK